MAGLMGDFIGSDSELGVSVQRFQVPLCMVAAGKDVEPPVPDNFKSWA